VTGVWGAETREALIAFQRKEGVEASGGIDTRTVTALGLSGKGVAGCPDQWLRLGAPANGDCRSVLALACASRHPGIALAIASASFPNEKLVLPAVLLYLIVSSIATLPYLRWSKSQVEHEHRPMMALR